jgi:2'-5' RNA ligase
MKTEEELIWESYTNCSCEDDVSYGCLMVYLDDDSANQIRQFCKDTFNPEILADYGIEDNPHVTCQYGFKDTVNVDDIKSFINQNVKTPINIKLGEISRFENEQHDVIKVEVDSPDLHQLSDLIRNHFGDNLDISFPNYTPHLTLAYVKSGSLPHIDGDNMFNGKNHVFNDFVYCDNNDEMYDIKKL